MLRGTTPTFHLTIQDESVDLTQAANVYASFKQLGIQIDKKGDDLVISPQTVDVYLSQKETLQFTEGDVEIQLNWTYANGERGATLIKSVRVCKNLIGRELE